MADNPTSGGLAQKAAAALGLPEGVKFFTPYPFGGINQQAAPTAIDDKEFVYLENFVKVGDGNLRTLWDVGASIYSVPAGKTIVYYAFYTLSTDFYCAIFLDDGSAVQLDMGSLAQTPIGSGTPFYQSGSGYLPFARQWGSTYLMISNRNTVNDYWAWDGTLLYGAGTAAPNGVNLTSIGFDYSATPTVTAYGGNGSGMSFTVEINGGAIQNVKIANPGSGYLPGDVVQIQFSGGGSDNSAVLTPYLLAGGVAGVSISAYGSNYTSIPAVSFSGGGGSGAAGTAILALGVSGYTSLVGGSGYTSTPTVTITGGGGAGATATATIAAGAVTGITITNQGLGYSTTPTITFTGGGGTGASATAVLSSGVVGVRMTSNGTGYTSAPAVSITGGGGSGAIAVSVLQPQGVGGVTVVDGGSGFTAVPTISLVGGGGSGAVVTAVLNGTSVAFVNLSAGGANYTAPPFVTVEGQGYTYLNGAPTNGGPAFFANMNGGQVVSITVANAGSGITSPLALVFTNQASDTTGAGAGGTVVFEPTSISSVVVSAAGKYYTNAPQAIVNAGANNAASATVELMPFGVSGSAMDTFLSRIWIIDPAVAPFETIPASNQWSFSSASSVADFSTSAGGGSAQNTDAFLQTSYANVRQSAGYLYFFGDGSTSVVTNVATSGTPATTTYNYQNVDPQAGLSWRDSLQEYGRSLVCANETGVFGLYGGAMSKVSAKIDQMLNAYPQGPAVYPAAGGVTPSSAVAMIFNVKFYLNLMTMLDPETKAARNVMLAWNEKDWFIASQSVSFTFIAAQKVRSEYVAWGTDGAKLYPLFAQPSANLPKRLWTKIYGGDSMFIQKEALYLWLQAQDQSASSAGVGGVVTSSVSTIGPLIGGAAPGAFGGPPFAAGEYTTVLDQPEYLSPASASAWNIWGTGLGGVNFNSMGLRFVTNSPDFILGNLVIGYRNVVAYSG